jgi:hypothetical protein
MIATATITPIGITTLKRAVPADCSPRIRAPFQGQEILLEGQNRKNSQMLEVGAGLTTRDFRLAAELFSRCR